MDTKLQNRFKKINSGTASRKFVKETIIQRYTKTNGRFDNKRLADPKINRVYKAFCYQRGIPVFLKDGSTDTKYASNMMIGPSVAVQILENIEINNHSTIFEPFCGAGYFSIFLSILKPKLLVCSDKFTPEIYDLQRTFSNALKYIYEDKIPIYTEPIWQQLDAARDNPSENYFYNLIFLHPPFGRALTKFSPELTRDQAVRIWLSSINNSKRLLENTSSLIVSVVPADWTEELTKPFSNETTNRIILLEEIEQFPTNIIVTRFINSQNLPET